MIRTIFDHELSEVERALVQMHQDVDQALGRALRAYEYAQHGSARALIAADGEINARRAGVEEAVLRLIARQQPIARDLRVCIAAIAIAADLERIGDYAAGVAALVLRDTLTPAPIPELHDLSRQVRSLLSQSITAVVERDATVEHRLAVADNDVDARYAQLLQNSLAPRFADQASLRHYMYGLFVAHNLERIADRAVNIAERAAWVATGLRRK
ncbi:MAG: phosphate signaling complex protein PhoU [Herpetosiphonaceae bacterium]|nr:phosphate signaling complex protein PhoU [Herpetosiphonaceae bacterium]